MLHQSQHVTHCAPPTSGKRPELSGSVCFTEHPFKCSGGENKWINISEIIIKVVLGTRCPCLLVSLCQSLFSASLHLSVLLCYPSYPASLSLAHTWIEVCTRVYFCTEAASVSFPCIKTALKLVGLSQPPCSSGWAQLDGSSVPCGLLHRSAVSRARWL